MYDIICLMFIYGLIILGLILLTFLYFKLTKSINSMQDNITIHWDTSYNKIAKYPILLINKDKPLHIANYRKLVYKKIKKNITKTLNTRIYDSFLIGNSETAELRLSYNEESFLPIEYKAKFDEIMNTVVVDLVKEYEKAGYDIEVSGDVSGFHLRIYAKL
jgi:hypothetical protein